MGLPRVRLKVQRLIVAAAVLALVYSVAWSDFRWHPYRAVLGPLTAAFLTWAVLDEWRWARPGCPRVLRVGMPLVAVGLIASCLLGARAERFLATAEGHYWEAEMCQRSAQGESGTLIVHFEDGCRWFDIPKAETAAERAKMSELATYHHGMEAKYVHAGRRPWFPPAPDPPTLPVP